MAQAHTDSNGFARAYWKVGSDAGCGNNRVSVTSTSILGTTLFCASATSNPAAQINIGTGNNQRAEVNGPTMESLRVWVNDGVNGVANIPVTFTVTQGGGRVNGANTATINTAVTGHAEVNFTLGPEAGNNFVEATFSGNTGSPATFAIYGVERSSQPTSLTGLALDNANQPIQGATCRLLIRGTTLRTTFSDSAGHFTFANIPAGSARLVVNGLTATAVNGDSIPPGSFPSLPIDLVIVPNAENRLPMPVLLPPLNPNNARVYDGRQDVELTVEGIEGLKMIVKAGSMKLIDGTVPDSANPAIISLNQVHFDKIPMPMTDGVAPPYSGTLQPAGSTFDPPVQIIFPNMTGLPPGTTSYFTSFNHEFNRFEIVATGRISADGLSFVSDPGSGIPVAGWHSSTPPPAPTDTVSNIGNKSKPGNNEPPKSCTTVCIPCKDKNPMDPVYLFSG